MGDSPTMWLAAGPYWPSDNAQQHSIHFTVAIDSILGHIIRLKEIIAFYNGQVKMSGIHSGNENKIILEAFAIASRIDWERMKADSRQIHLKSSMLPSGEELNDGLSKEISELKLLDKVMIRTEQPFQTAVGLSAKISNCLL